MEELLKVGSEFKLTEVDEVVKEWSDNSKVLSGKLGKIIGHTGRTEFPYLIKIEGYDQIEARSQDIIPINEDWEKIIEQ